MIFEYSFDSDPNNNDVIPDDHYVHDEFAYVLAIAINIAMGRDALIFLDGLDLRHDDSTYHIRQIIGDILLNGNIPEDDRNGSIWQR